MTSTSQPNALVTGAGRGLGLALARALLADGWRVVVDARRSGHLAAALPGAVVVPGGTWVRDPCIRLSQDEVCARLSDRRYEILRVYHAAMPSQRTELDREQRQIDAHLADHCPGY